MANVNDCIAIALVSGGIWVFLCWLIGLATSCWLTNIHVENRWEERYNEILEDKDYDVMNDLLRSFQVTPFIDVLATSEDLENCPQSHPFELVYDIWPGSYTHCDCL